MTIFDATACLQIDQREDQRNTSGSFTAPLTCRTHSERAALRFILAAATLQGVDE